MTCQHCQTWILDGDHRCRRCGRRVRNTGSRISPEVYPVAATATAYNYDVERDRPFERQVAPQTEKTGQQSLFPTSAAPPRVISFDSFTTQAEREAIRAREAGLSRPAPLKTGRVELRHARSKKTLSTDQHNLDFFGKEEVLPQPTSHIICDAPVAPARLRIEAVIIDCLLVALGCVLPAAMFWYEGGQLSVDKHVAPFLILAIVTVPLFYKLVWTYACRDTIGMKWAGVRLVDFDGNPPSHERRYQRLFGGIISLLAAGIGLIWALVDEDSLTWGDHISDTFPTIASED